MQQGLGDVAAAAGDAGQAPKAHEQGDDQDGLAPAEAPDAVELQLVQVHEHGAGGKKEGELEKRVVQHVQGEAVDRPGALLPQQLAHGDAGEDEADLAHGGAGQGALQVGAENAQHRPGEHGDHGEGQHYIAPGGVVEKDLGGEHQDAEDARLGDDAGEQGRGRGRGHGMGRGQPGVEGPHTALGAEAEGGEGAGNIEPGPVFIAGGQGLQAGDVHRAEHVLQHEEAHQGDKAADHGKGQVAVRRLHGAGGLLVGNQGPGGHAHDLEANQQRIEIRRQEHAQGGALGDEIVEIVAALVLGMGQILLAEDRAAEPENRAHQAEDPAQAVQREAQAQAADAGKVEADGRGKARDGQQDHQQQLRGGHDPAGEGTEGFPREPADETAQHRQQHQHRQEDGRKRHVFSPPFT